MRKIFFILLMVAGELFVSNTALAPFVPLPHVSSRALSTNGKMLFETVESHFQALTLRTKFLDGSREPLEAKVNEDQYKFSDKFYAKVIGSEVLPSNAGVVLSVLTQNSTRANGFVFELVVMAVDPLGNPIAELKDPKSGKQVTHVIHHDPLIDQLAGHWEFNVSASVKIVDDYPELTILGAGKGESRWSGVLRFGSPATERRVLEHDKSVHILGMHQIRETPDLKIFELLAVDENASSPDSVFSFTAKLQSAEGLVVYDDRKRISPPQGVRIDLNNPAPEAFFQVLGALLRSQDRPYERDNWGRAHQPIVAHFLPDGAAWIFDLRTGQFVYVGSMAVELPEGATRLFHKGQLKDIAIGEEYSTPSTQWQLHDDLPNGEVTLTMSNSKKIRRMVMERRNTMMGIGNPLVISDTTVDIKLRPCEM